MQTLQRFAVNPGASGNHAHHLVSSRRHGRLSRVWKNFLGLIESTNSSAALAQKYGWCHEVVGHGAFGTVRVSHKKMENGAGEKLYAVKQFRRRPKETEMGHRKRLIAEFCIAGALRHPNIVRTIDLLPCEKGSYCGVMEFCDGGDLYSLIRSAGKLQVQEADCFFKQMMRGIEYMHDMGVAHLDLKPENLLLTPHGVVKISDFGHSHCFRLAWESDVTMVSGPRGSTPYVAPEAYANKEFDARGVDIWACGIIYMVMRTGRFLWDVADRKNEYYARYLEDRRKEEGYEPIEALHRVSFCLKSVLTPNHAIRLSHWLMHHSGSVPKRSLLHLGPCGFTTHHCLPGVEL
jgi:protein-serine/threonine kinase